MLIDVFLVESQIQRDHEYLVENYVMVLQKSYSANYDVKSVIFVSTHIVVLLLTMQSTQI